jgi:sn-glycerol 3-phosphate transport system substrate-binding protein
MKRWAGIVALLTMVVLLASPRPSYAKTEIYWWHAMTSVLGERVNEIAAKFNASQSEYEVKAIHKGSYPETLNAAIAAYRAKQAPHIVQVYEVGTQTMLSSGAVYPVYQLMQDNHITVDWNDLIGPVKSYYSTGGHLYSMAFNSSTPILFYNKDLFKKAGLPDTPPATWGAVEAMAKKLVAAGVKCGFSAAWPSWTLVENMHALHDQPFADHANGFDGLATTLKINGAFGVKMMELLQRGAKEGWFTYNGRLNKAEASMGGGACGIFLTSSAYIGNLTRASAGKFTWGTGPLPRMEGFPRGNSIIGGATLWVMNQKDPKVYKGIAKFFTFLSSPEVQENWHESTGYVPITLAAYELAKKKGLYEQRPGFDTAIKELNNKPPTANSKGIRLGNFVQIRNIIDEELEAVWSGQKTAKVALDSAVSRGNVEIERFRKVNQ